MEYSRAYRDETPDGSMIDRHEREIFPLMKRRHLFSGSADFCLYDFHGSEGGINDNVFAYSNRAADERSLVFYNNSYYQTSGWIYRGAAAIHQKDGTVRQHTLCQTLALHAEDRFFTIFREQRSGLWYIRSSKEIAERGLFATLNGYEAQVFLDIQEMEDESGAKPETWESRWSLLNHRLNGRGVPNLEEAALDILLSDLYTPFREIFSPVRLKTLSGFFAHEGKTAGNAVSDTVEFIESFKEPVNAFAAAARKAAGLRSSVAGIAGAWKGWAAYLEKLTAAGQEAAAPDAALACVALGYSTLTLLRTAFAQTAGKDAAGADAAGTDAAALAARWQLDRVMRQCWESAGVLSGQARRAADIAVALLARMGGSVHGVFAAEKTAGGRAAAIIMENYEADDFRKILGINRFDDATWFNKEAFEECLLLVPFLLSLESAAKGRKTIAAVVQAFRKAQELSGYQLDKLLASLTAGVAAEPDHLRLIP
jgi:hypothetical protein